MGTRRVLVQLGLSKSFGRSRIASLQVRDASAFKKLRSKVLRVKTRRHEEKDLPNKSQR